MELLGTSPNTEHSQLQWSSSENENRIIYSAKIKTPFGNQDGEYDVIINKNPKKVSSYIRFTYFSPHFQGYKMEVLCKNEVGSTPMSVEELIKVVEDDYISALERKSEFMKKLRDHEIKQVEERLRISPYSILSKQ